MVINQVGNKDFELGCSADDGLTERERSLRERGFREKVMNFLYGFSRRRLQSDIWVRNIHETAGDIRELTEC